MPIDPGPALLQTTLATSAAIVAALALRVPLRRLGGWRSAYAIWALLPAAWLAAMLPAPVRYVSAAVAVPSSADSPATATMPALDATAAFDPWPWLAAVWIAGFALRAWLYLRSQRAFVRSLGALRPYGDGLLRAEGRDGLPAVVGLRGKLIVPSDFDTRYDPRERELILAHEHVHLRRGDTIANACVAALCCLYWFNPLMAYAAGRYRRDQELACDEAVVLRHPGARRAYGEAMLKTQLSEFPAPLACHWYGQHPLMERIVMLKQPVASAPRRRAGLAAAFAAALLGTFAAWAARPPVAAIAADASQQRFVSLEALEKPANALAAEAAAQVGLRLSNPEALSDHPVTVKLERVPAETVLDLLGGESGLDAVIENDEVRFVAARQTKPAAAPGAPPIDLRMKLTVGEKTSTPRILSRSGEQFMIKHLPEPGSEGQGTMTVTGTATLLSDGKIAIETEVRRNGEIIGKPTIRVADGKTGSIRIEDEGQPAFFLEIDASARPERYRDIPLRPRTG